jgi:hypothetical protein
VKINQYCMRNHVALLSCGPWCNYFQGDFFTVMKLCSSRKMFLSQSRVCHKYTLNSGLLNFNERHSMRKKRLINISCKYYFIIMAPPKSKCWQYFTKLSKETAQCNMCSKILKTSGNTSNLMCHVKQKHSKIYNKSGSSAGVSDVTEVVTETPCKKAKSNKVIDNQVKFSKLFSVYIIT